jgi:predicted XRE-type DNA-binding protein
MRCERETGVKLLKNGKNMDKVEIKKYLKRNDMKNVAELLGVSRSVVTDAMRKGKTDNGIVEALRLLAMKRKAQAEKIATELFNNDII